MFTLYPESVIYVVCPANYKTGGTELEHQLVWEINNQGGRAEITYYNWKNYSEPINAAYKIYVSHYTKIEKIVDDSKNIIIIPEIKPYLCNQYKNIQKAIWWMSVDNYVKNSGFGGAIKVMGLHKACKSLFKRRIPLFPVKINKNSLHLYQSEYAKNYLRQNNFHSYRLSDYINDLYFQNELNICDRRKRVLYNPKKGFYFTQKLIKFSPDIEWYPLVNLSSEEIRDILNSSMVYIDFGNHPGKDRFPREAAISGCCVITSKCGSAAFFEDVPIPDKYKFDNKKINIPKIIETINMCLDNYEQEIENFDYYRKIIKQEHDVFVQDVNRLFIRH